MTESLNDKVDDIRFLLYVIVGELAIIALYTLLG